MNIITGNNCFQPDEGKIEWAKNIHVGRILTSMPSSEKTRLIYDVLKKCFLQSLFTRRKNESHLRQYG